MIELWQFSFAMYPEMARWALDYKQLPHVRHTLLPGPHAAQLVPRFGQKTMPILRNGEVLVKDAASVIDHLERAYPQHPLYPADAGQRRRALEIRDWFGNELGPAVRRAAFFDLLPHGPYMADLWSVELGAFGRRLYAALFPVFVRPIMYLDMKITAAGAEAGREKTRKALDFVARESAATGYLAGDAFSVADLYAASVLFLTRFCPEYPASLPQPYPEGLQRWVNRWADHPGGDYVQRMYASHRNPDRHS